MNIYCREIPIKVETVTTPSATLCANTAAGVPLNLRGLDGGVRSIIF